MPSHKNACGYAIGACLALGLATSAVEAQTQEQFDSCSNEDSRFSPDVRLGACTAAIQSGLWSGKDLAWAFSNRGIAYRAKKDYDRAIADQSEAIRLDPTLSAAYINRGVAYRAKNDYNRAIADYNEAIRLDPRRASAFNNRANVYLAKKEYDHAIADLSEAVRLEPQLARRFFNRALAYEHKGDKERAIADYRHAFSLDPDPAYVEALQRLGASP